MTDEVAAAQEEAVRLDALAAQFTAALDLKERGDLDRAEEMLHRVLRAEPRLPEPRMELARILLDTDRLADAEEHARLALEHLEGGGRWTDSLPPGVVEAIAHALLAEILRRRLEEDDVIFGDPEGFRRMLQESQQLFARAHTLDPTDETSSYYALFLGDPAAGPPGEDV
jgi:tetratricopeptide (TPR) repeat protein